ncbi:MAG: hypothetical protein H6707_09185 [Deltaproteobacteria bacterium]|nr:hypothetical protein [Deltaproteobacteria bacterium]
MRSVHLSQWVRPAGRGFAALVVLLCGCTGVLDGDDQPTGAGFGKQSNATAAMACRGERLRLRNGHCAPVRYPASGREVGVDYHATGEDFLGTAFLTQYHRREVRALVRQQLRGMALAGATVISTRIWLVSAAGTQSPETWRHHFPLSAREQTNLRAYAKDVADARLKLYLGVLYLGCASYLIGSPQTTLGACQKDAPTFVSEVKQSFSRMLEAVQDVYLPDGRPVVERIYFDGEVMAAASAEDSATQFEKANSRWFIGDSGLWRWFWQATRTAGMIPSMYFIHGNQEHKILGPFVDGAMPAVSGHRSMYWIYRSLKFLKDNALPIPDRIDFSSYPRPEHANYATLFNRIMSDFEEIIPALLGVRTKDYFIAETFYHPDETLRRNVHRALALQLQIRRALRGVTFWTTPNAGGPGGGHAAFPFDPSGLSTPLALAKYADPSFEVDGYCGTADGLSNPAEHCTQWANGNVASYQIGRSELARHDGQVGLLLRFGHCQSKPCSGSAYPGIFALSDPLQSDDRSPWLVTRFFARYDGDDNAASVRLLANASQVRDAVAVVKDSAFSEYVLIGKRDAADLRLRWEILNPSATDVALQIDTLR